MIRRLLRKRWVQAGLVVGTAITVVGLAAFEPWKLWVDETVVEALPVAPASAAVVPVQMAAETPTQKSDAMPDGMSGQTAARPSASPTANATPATALVEEYRGEFISHEHGTSGSVRVLRLPDGSRVLRLENLDTSNGPDLKVVLSDAPVIPGKAGWHVFDDNEHRKIANLKGNKGSQNYAIPGDLDLKQLRSISIWCDRFNVSFGAAELRAA